jgi:leucyl aminopeptidase
MALPQIPELKITPEDGWQGLRLLPLPYSAGDLTPGKKPGDVVLDSSYAGGGALLVSLGAADEITLETLRRAGGQAARWLLEHDQPQVGLPAAMLDALEIPGASEAFYTGLVLGAYRFDHYRSKPPENQPSQGLQAVHLLHSGDGGDLALQAARWQAALSGVYLARSTAHEPPNVINPASLAQRTSELAQASGLSMRVLDAAELQALGAGALLAVGQGSQSGARLIMLEYPGSGEGRGEAPVIVVGKAITFDTGGYSIKDRVNMVGMKYDKCGGAAVLGILQAAAELRLPTPVVGVIAAAENMISADAYRPNDILTTLSGKTVEVISADAEGRLVLADALTYVQRQYQPRAILDLATLTGGIVIALGKVRAGLMSNDDALAQALFEAGERSGERLWRMPLDDDYFELIKGDDSDFKNSSEVRQAHPIVGGIFLKQFIEPGISWAHLDIAGPAIVEKDQPYLPKGATGFGVRLVLDYLSSL